MPGVRVQPAVPQLTAHDIKVLVAYDRQSGCLLKSDSRSGQVDAGRIEELHESGTIQRLLENRLIHPTGKLTPQGLEEARRLAGVAELNAIARGTRQQAVPPPRDRRLAEVESAVDAATSAAPDRNAAGIPVRNDENDFISVYDAPSKPEVVQHPPAAPPCPVKAVAEPPRAAPAPAPARPLMAEGKPSPPAPAPAAPAPAATAPAAPAPAAPAPAAPAPAAPALPATAPAAPAPAATAPPAMPAATPAAVPPVAFRSAFADGPAAPCNTAAIDRTLVVLLDPDSFEAEQFKILRTNILYPLAGKPPRSILLTSAAPEDGKTFAAANVAISIALNINRYVLLIDADLRRPQLNARFGFGAVPGLSNYLAEGTPLSSLLLRTRVDKLTLLPSGPPPANPSELLSSERMASLITEVTNRYPDRLIVIDAPPPSFAAETGVLARQVDGIIVVVRYRSTRRREISELKARLGEQKIIGCVVNYIENPISRYYGYKYGGYGRRKHK